MEDIIIAHATKNLCYKEAKKMVPKGIVVHSTGANNPNLKRYVDAPDTVGINRYGNHWNKEKPGGTKKCVHAFIGYDKDKQIKVAEILPLDICAWGVGKGKKGSYNFSPSYIQFEICEDALSDKIYYTKVFDKAIKYCAYLCEAYNLEVCNIVGHCEAHRLGYGSNHSDPERWMKKQGETMNDFRNAVSEILKKDKPQEIIEKESSDETKNELPYLVKVQTKKLNIRKGPGTNYSKSGKIIDFGVYTIIEEKIGKGASLWGKLKSGAGWISLDYVKKLKNKYRRI